MALTSKPVQPLDRAIAVVLATEVERAGISRRALAERTGMSLNRIGIILRQEPPPAAVGEVWLIASALDLSTSDVIARAEASLSAPSSDSPDAEPGQESGDAAGTSGPLGVVRPRGSGQVPARRDHEPTRGRVPGAARTSRGRR